MASILGRIEFGASSIDGDELGKKFATIQRRGTQSSEFDCGHKWAAGCQSVQATDYPSTGISKCESTETITVADAIIDNREELAAEFGLSVCELESTSNATLIRSSYSKWGKDCVDRLLGDFAFAIIDKKAKHVFLARDHIGSRPLFWARVADTLLFSTHVQSILDAHEHAWKINENTIAEFLAYPTRPVTRTFFHEINRVPAGSYLSLTKNKISRVRWWNPRVGPTKQDSDVNNQNLITKTRNILAQSVRDRIKSQSNIGSHLSGGIDSTTVTLFAAQHLRSNNRNLTAAYSWSPVPTPLRPTDNASDERIYIQNLARDFDLPARFSSFDQNYFLHLLQRPMEFENNTDVADEFPIMRAAERDKIDIMLSGWGGDEAYSAHGFGYIGYLVVRGKFHSAIRFARQKYGALRNRQALSKLLWYELVKPLMPPFVFQRLRHKQWFDGRTSFAAQPFNKKYKDVFKRRRRILKFGLNPNQNLKNLLFQGHIGMRMEAWAAWSEEYGYQYRYPLTDRRLLECLLLLPPEILFTDDRSRGLSLRILGRELENPNPKLDLANEMVRADTRCKVWEAIAQAIEAGEYEDDCPWIDKSQFFEYATRRLPIEHTDHIATFAEIYAAARIWALYRRACSNDWV